VMSKLKIYWADCMPLAECKESIWSRG